MAFWVEEAGSTTEQKQETILVAEATEKQSIVEFKTSFEEYFQVLLEAAHRHCPKDTGALDSTIRLEDISASMESSIGTEMGYTPPISEDIQSTEVVREAGFGKRIVAGGMAINPRTGREVDYASYVHDGHFTKGGGFVMPRPFLDDAMREAEAYLESVWTKYSQKVGSRWEN